MADLTRLNLGDRIAQVWHERQQILRSVPARVKHDYRNAGARNVLLVHKVSVDGDEGYEPALSMACGSAPFR